MNSIVRSGLDEKNLKLFYKDLGKFICKKSLKCKALLQKNYGDVNDCTLTSMACIFGEEYYDKIEKTAIKYGHNTRNGTNPFTVKQIMTSLGFNGTAYSSYGKNIGYNYTKIKSLIDNNILIILNITNDGRNYYKNHSVTIIGYEEYVNHKFLLVYDNWCENVCYIDYDKLCVVSSINWFKFR